MMRGNLGNGGTRRLVLDTACVIAVAFAARLTFVLISSGGPSGNFGYDPSVYYAAADALTFGRVPYADFVLLHPPALMLLLTPFAALGRLTTDHTGFIAANTAFLLLGAVNAGLVVLVARRLRLARFASVLGGCFYAIWFGSIGAEAGLRLEPLGCLAFLCALLLLAGVPTTVANVKLSPGRNSRWPTIIAGAMLGLAVSTKIWWIVPAVIVLAWYLLTERRRPVGWWLIGGFAGAAVLIDGPFFLLAPGQMWRMVVVDQLGRPFERAGLSRLDRASTLNLLIRSPHSPVAIGALLVVSVLAAVVTAAAWRVVPARLITIIAGAQVLVLLTSPSFFGFYDDYLAASISLVIAAAASRSVRRDLLARSGVAAAGALVLVAGAATVAAPVVGGQDLVSAFPGRQLASGVTRVHCLMADSPMALIELNALSRDFSDGCPDWVDVTGRTYGPDKALPGTSVRRSRNRRWQRDLERYLLSGNAVIVIRGATGYSPLTRQIITRLPVLERRHPWTVYAVSRGRTTGRNCHQQRTHGHRRPVGGGAARGSERKGCEARPL